MKTFVLGFCSLSGVAALKASGITLASDLVGELVGKIEKDAVEFKASCSDDMNERVVQIAALEPHLQMAKDEKAEKDACVLQQEGEAMSIQSRNPDVGGNLVQLHQELHTLETARAEKRHHHETTVKEMESAGAMLERVREILKDTHDNVENGPEAFLDAGRQRAVEVVKALQVLVQAGSVFEAGKAKRVRSLLEETASGIAHGTKSVLETVEKLQEDTHAQLRETHKKELHDVSAYHSEETALKETITEKEKAAKDFHQVAFATQSKMTGCQAAGQQLDARIKEVQGQLDTMNHDLKNQKTHCAERDEQMGKELAALKEAEKELKNFGKPGGDEALLQETLLQENSASESSQSSDEIEKAIAVPTSFLQKLQKLERKNAIDEVKSSAREEAALLLRRVGKATSSAALLQAAIAAEKDPFQKVRDMIERMIAELEKKKAQESSDEKVCQEDLAKAKKIMQEKVVFLDRKKSSLAETILDGQAVEQAIAEGTKLISQYTETLADNETRRAKHKKENAETIDEATRGSEALSKAIALLAEFYGKNTSFVQLSAKNSSSFVQLSEKESPLYGSEGGQIVVVLEQAQTDMAQLKTETQVLEEQQKNTYNEQKLSLTENLSKTKTQKANDETRNTELWSEHQDLADEVEQLKQAATAATGFLEGRQKECDGYKESHTRRIARRKEEIKGLKAALTILDEDGAEPEAFVQLGNQ